MTLRTHSTKSYFQTNAELAKENSNLQQTISRSTKMNNLLLAQGFEMHTKLAVAVSRNNLLREKNESLKKKIRLVKENATILTEHLNAIQLSPFQSSPLHEAKCSLKCREPVSMLTEKFFNVEIEKGCKKSEVSGLTVIEEERNDENQLTESHSYHVNNAIEYPSNIHSTKNDSLRNGSVPCNKTVNIQNTSIQNNKTENSHNTSISKSTEYIDNMNADLINDFSDSVVRSRRHRKQVSYKLPSLNTKLRQGDPFTYDF